MWITTSLKYRAATKHHDRGQNNLNADDIGDSKYRPDLVGSCSIEQAFDTAVDDADGRKRRFSRTHCERHHLRQSSSAEQRLQKGRRRDV
jgi:hypothetical protein